MPENEYSGSTETTTKKVIFNSEIPEEGKIDEFPQLNADSEEIDVRSVKAFEEIFPDESPEDNVPEKKELTEEEKKKLFIENLKNSKKAYHPKKNFGVAYHKKRKTKNKMQRQSRRNNR